MNESQKNHQLARYVKRFVRFSIPFIPPQIFWRMPLAPWPFTRGLPNPCSSSPNWRPDYLSKNSIFFTSSSSLSFGVAQMLWIVLFVCGKNQTRLAERGTWENWEKIRGKLMRLIQKMESKREKGECLRLILMSKAFGTLWLSKFLALIFMFIGLLKNGKKLTFSIFFYPSFSYGKRDIKARIE